MRKPAVPVLKKGPAQRLYEFITGQLAGSDMDIVMGGMRKGFIADTASRIAIIHAIKAAFNIANSFEPGDDAPVLFGHGEPSAGYPIVGEVRRVVWVFTIITLAEASLDAAVFFSTLIPPLFRKIRRYYIWIDTVTYFLYLVGMARYNADPRVREWSYVMRSFSVLFGRVGVLAAYWIFTYAVSPSPSALLLGRITFFFSLICWAGMLIAGEIMVGYDGASSFGRPIIGLLLWSVFCVLGFLVCSPRYSKDFGGTGDFSPESHHEKARVLMGVASGKRDVEDDGVATCECVRCSGTVHRMLSHAHGASMGRQRLYEFGGSELCWWGAFLAWANDDFQMLRLSVSLMWIFVPLGFGVMGWALVQLMMLAFKLPNCDFLIYGLPDKAEAGNFTHVAMPLLFGFSALTTFGVGVRLSRITAEQRDQLLLDIVPPEVAEVLIRRVAQKQARIDERSYRGEILSDPTEAQGRTSRQSQIGKKTNVVTLGNDATQRDSNVSKSMSGNDILGSGGFDARKAVGISTKNLTFYKEHEDVSMMFSDLVGFTSLSAKIHPRTALVMLHSFFSSLDLVTSYLRIFKYETVGDAFITASNLLRKEPEHHVSALKMGVTLISVARDMMIELPDGSSIQLQARVGLHCGPVAAGVLGRKRSVMCLVGDTMNTASRMESTSVPSAVQATDEFYSALPGVLQALFEERKVDVKGKGTMKTWLLDVAAKERECAQLGLNLQANPVTWDNIQRMGDGGSATPTGINKARRGGANKRKMKSSLGPAAFN